MKKCILFLFALLTMCLCAFVLPSLFAWSEHHYHADWVRQILAPSLAGPDGKETLTKQEWDEFVKLYSYYPDWGFDRSGKRSDELWDYFISAQVKNRFDNTHSNKTTVQYFKLLIDSFSAGETQKAALWAGCLTHVIGDAAAANHPPLLAYLTYGYGRTLGLNIGSSGERISKHERLLDVSGPSADTLGKKYIQEALKDYRPALLAENAEDAAVKLQLILQDGFLLALKEEGEIARGFELWAGEQDQRGKEALMRGMARLVVKCSRDAADVIYTALKLSEKNQTFDVERALVKAKPAITRLRKACPLSEVSAYDGILKETSASPAVGVLLGLPPIYWVTPGSVDLQLCYFLSLIARTLAEQKTPYVTCDITNLPTSLDPRRIPVLIVPTYQDGDGLNVADLEGRLRDYRQKGGRILFVGGSLKAVIKPLSDFFLVSPDGDGSYPVKGKELLGKKLVVAKGLAAEAPMPFVRVMYDFSTRTVGSYILKSDLPASVKPVLFLDTGDKQLAVSGGYVEEDSFMMIYVPWYLFLPGSLSAGNELHHLDRPTLDPSGRKILNLMLGLLKAGDKSGRRP